MWKRMFTSIIFIMSLLLTACSSDDGIKTNTNAEQNKAMEYSDRGGFLWKVENGNTEVYLQGTIHLGTKDTYPLNEYAEKAYEEADIIMPEIDLTSIDLEKMQEMVVDRAMYQEEKSIRDDVSEASLEKLEKIMEDAGLELEFIENFKPWYLDTLLLELAMEDTDLSSNYSVDSYFLDRAAEDDKEIRELESFESQMELLSGFSMEQQIESLEYTIDMYEELGEETERMFDAWLDGDVDRLLDYDDSLLEENSEYKEKMNDERNMDMAASIEEILKEDTGQTYFVIVGTMHYIEEPSIVSILEETYEVKHVY